MNLRRSWALETALVAVPAFVFIALAAYHLTLPGLYYDEAADAIPALDLLQGRQPELVRPHGIALFGRTWPLMAFDYVGAVHTYASLAFFSVLGPSVGALRLMTIAGGALTVALTAVWVRHLFSSRMAGAGAALLLATHPSWVFYARQGVHVSSLMALWLMGALLLLLAWRRTGSVWWLAGAGLLLGLGLSTKILFLWAILALGFIGLAWQGPTLWRTWRNPGGAVARLRRALKPAVAVAVAVVGGAAPLLIYNLQTGATLDAVAKSAEVTTYGVHNADYPANLLARLDTLWALLHGGHFWFLGGLYGNHLFPPAVLVGAATACALAVRWPPLRGAIALLLGFTFLVVVQSPVTISGIWPTHLFILLPLLCAIPVVALAAAVRAQSGALRRLGHIAAPLTIAILAAGNLTVDAQYHEALVRTGGHRGHSDAVYKLASYLDENGVPAPLAMDWGIRYTVQLVTAGRVRPLEVFGYTAEPDPGFAARLPLATAEQRYLFHGEDYTAFPRMAAFEQAAAQAGKRTKLEQTFYERSGTPVFMVYSVE